MRFHQLGREFDKIAVKTLPPSVMLYLSNVVRQFKVALSFAQQMESHTEFNQFGQEFRRIFDRSNSIYNASTWSQTHSHTYKMLVRWIIEP